MKRLKLSSCRIGNKGCRFLSMACLPKLESLCLSINGITAEGIKHLSKGKWNQIIDVDLNGNSLNMEACKHLTKANIPNLVFLNLICKEDIDREK